MSRRCLDNYLPRPATSRFFRHRLKDCRRVCKITSRADSTDSVRPTPLGFPGSVWEIIRAIRQTPSAESSPGSTRCCCRSRRIPHAPIGSIPIISASRTAAEASPNGPSSFLRAARIALDGSAARATMTGPQQHGYAVRARLRRQMGAGVCGVGTGEPDRGLLT